MTQAQTQSQTEPELYTFDEFIEWYPENSEFRYELHDGIIFEMPKPRGKHSNLTGSLAGRLLTTIDKMGKTDIWTIPRESIVKPKRDKSGYEPDIIVLNQETIVTETRWESESVIQNATSIKLIVEVVSQCVAEPVLKTGFPSQATGVSVAVARNERHPKGVRVPRVEATDDLRSGSESSPKGRRQGRTSVTRKG